MGYRNTPLPPGLNFDEAFARGDMYRKYHSLYVDELSSRLSDDEFEAVKEKASKCQRLMKKLGDAIHEKHGAYLQHGVDKDYYEGKTFKKMVITILLVMAAITFFTDNQYVAYPGVGILALWGYRHHVAAQELGKSKRALADRERELKSLKRDLEDICPAYPTDRIKTDDFIILSLLSADLSGNETVTHKGMVDRRLLPHCMRTTEDEAQTIINHFGANFENYEDPRVPDKMWVILWYKLLIANVPLNLQWEIQEKLEQDYGYGCSPQWDYQEFLMSFEAGKIKRIEVGKYE